MHWQPAGLCLPIFSANTLCSTLCTALQLWASFVALGSAMSTALRQVPPAMQTKLYNRQRWWMIPLSLYMHWCRAGGPLVLLPGAPRKAQSNWLNNCLTFDSKLSPQTLQEQQQLEPTQPT
jgi:7,8-dihydro-6-hydroxymethylpterin-pyrophosphokinase